MGVVINTLDFLQFYTTVVGRIIIYYNDRKCENSFEQMDYNLVIKIQDLGCGKMSVAVI